MDTDRVRLVDIGNTHAKIYYHESIKVLKAEDFWLEKEFFYISVNHDVNKKLLINRFAKNLEPFISLKTDYKGLGVDRKVLCSYIDDGVIVDAGSAVTVDIMSSGYHKGGFILPGINAFFQTYKSISPALDVKRELPDLDKLPQNTTQAINFAVFSSVVRSIKDISKDKKIYFCGGDGKILSSYFENSVYEEDLIFKAMKKIIKDL